MTTSTADRTTPDAPGAPLRILARIVGMLAILWLAYQAIHFYLRDPLHYIVDQSEKSFGNYWPHRTALLLHITGGTLALFCGPFQLWTGLRRQALPIHRWVGYGYITGIALGGGAAFYLGSVTQPRDFGVALWGLAGAWWLTVAMAYIAIRRGRIEAHREWMIRGYVVTFAFVSFRWLVEFPIWKPLGNARFAEVAWICWVVPLMIAEVALQWRRTVGPRSIPRHPSPARPA